MQPVLQTNDNRHTTYRLNWPRGKISEKCSLFSGCCAHILFIKKRGKIWLHYPVHYIPGERGGGDEKQNSFIKT